MPYRIVRNNIALMECDAIVNTASEFVNVGPGCDTAIYTAAGFDKLLAYRRDNIGELPEGSVFVTPGFDLKAAVIIHAVSPLVEPDEEGEKAIRAVYKRVFATAKGLKVRELAIPLISTGSFGFPKELGLRIALDETLDFLSENKMDISIVIFDKKSTEIAKGYSADLKEYIDDKYIDEYRMAPSAAFGNVPVERKNSFIEKFKNKRLKDLSLDSTPVNTPFYEPCGESERDESVCEEVFSEHYGLIDERLKHMKDSFSEYLLYMITLKGMTNAEVYNRAIVNKKVFSKIKNNPDYHPNKMTAMCLCVGAKLNIDEARDLLARAGYALSPSNKTDIVFSYFIENKIYDMIELDITLEEFGLPCLIQ